MGKYSMQICNRLNGNRLLVVGLVLFVVCIFGCGKNGPAMAPVKCRVLLDGKPLEGAAVGFIPVDGGPVASGLTDAEGFFELITMNRPGAPVGKHTVTVTKTENTGINPDGTIAPSGITTTWQTPKRYSNPSTSGLTAVVEPDGLERVFELSSN